MLKYAYANKHKCVLAWRLVCTKTRALNMVKVLQARYTGLALSVREQCVELRVAGLEKILNHVWVLGNLTLNERTQDG